MAYVECEPCGRTAFTTAYWSNTDHCHYCGAELPHPLSVAESSQRPAQVTREYQSPDPPPHTQRPAA